MEELLYYRKTIKGLVVVMIRELEDAMDAYADKEMDQSEANRTYRMG